MKHLDELKRFYRQLDGKVKYTLKREKIKISCKPKCNHCCSLLTTIHALEGVFLAREVLRRKDWWSIAKKARVAAVKGEEVGASRREYFNAGIPCPLLGETGLCSLYQSRPAACRLHMVVSEPDLCSPSNQNATTCAVNTSTYLALFLKRCIEISGIEMVVAPLPLMLLFCMERGATKENSKELLPLIEGLPTPIQWAMRAASNDDWGKELSTSEQNAMRAAYLQVFKDGV